jgi:hypothetical protein
MADNRNIVVKIPSLLVCWAHPLHDRAYWHVQLVHTNCMLVDCHQGVCQRTGTDHKTRMAREHDNVIGTQPR